MSVNKNPPIAIPKNRGLYQPNNWSFMKYRLSPNSAMNVTKNMTSAVNYK